MSTISNKAIILGGRIMGLTAIRSLAKHNVETILLYHDDKDYATVSKYLNVSFQSPHPEKNELEFIQYLVNLSSKYSGAVIFPTDDEYLITIAKHKKLLSEHFIIATNDLEIISKLVNKSYVYEISSKAGIPTPKNLVTSNNNDAYNFAKEIGFPCLVKPSQSHIYVKAFGKKMAKVFDFQALEKELDEAASLNLEVMIQEFIPGNDCDNYSYWGFRYKDSFYAEATAQKVRNDPPGTGSPRVQVTKNIPELIPLSRKILNELNYQGYANVEYKKDTRTNEYKFMEINPRINRCMQQAIAGGIDYPWLIFNQLKNDVLPTNLNCKEGIYWIDLAKDMIRNFQFRNIEKYNLKEYLYPYFHKHVFAVLSFSDIKPFIKRSIGFISK